MTSESAHAASVRLGREPTPGPTRDDECVRFLRWALASLGMRWPGFRRPRRQVCRRARRRAAELGLDGLDAYRAHLETHPEEWSALDRLCVVTISRFCRDHAVFGLLGDEVLPELAGAATAARRSVLRVWSAGCAAGEEPYSVALLWWMRLARTFPELELRVLATDIDAAMLRRAREGCYERSSLKELPAGWREQAFVLRGGRFCLGGRYRRGVLIRQHDIRCGPPADSFDLVLCRNLAFTYFEAGLQERIGRELVDCLRPGGALVIGAHESPPPALEGLAAWSASHGIHRRATAASTGANGPRYRP